MVSRKVDAAIRGTAKASKALSYLKEALGKKRICRLALLLTVGGTPFFLAPVGIDEGEYPCRQTQDYNVRCRTYKEVRDRACSWCAFRGQDWRHRRNKRVDRTLADGEFVQGELLNSGSMPNTIQFLSKMP